MKVASGALLSYDLIALIASFLKRRFATDLAQCCKSLFQKIDATYVDFCTVAVDDTLFPDGIPRNHIFGSFDELTQVDSGNFPLLSAKQLRSVRSLTFYDSTDDVNFIWPSALEEINIGRIDNDDEHFHLPASLKRIIFSNNFNTPFDRVTFNEGLVEIRLEDDCFFNHPIEHIRFPDSLKTLKLGAAFNQPVEQLQFPTSLRYLEFGDRFDQPVEQCQLPPNLVSLIFGKTFNSPIGALPSSLKVLKLGNWFNFPLVRLPKGLVELSIGSIQGNDFKQDLSFIEFPGSLRVVSVPDRSFVFGSTYYRSLPETLEKLILFGVDDGGANEPIPLPSGLHTLELFAKACDISTSSFPHLILPAGLKHLVLDTILDPIFPVIQLPDSLQQLSFQKHHADGGVGGLLFIQRLIYAGKCPSQLKRVTFGSVTKRPHHFDAPFLLKCCSGCVRI